MLIPLFFSAIFKNSVDYRKSSGITVFFTSGIKIAGLCSTLVYISFCVNVFVIVPLQLFLYSLSVGVNPGNFTLFLWEWLSNLSCVLHLKQVILNHFTILHFHFELSSRASIFCNPCTSYIWPISWFVCLIFTYQIQFTQDICNFHFQWVCLAFSWI